MMLIAMVGPEYQEWM